MCWHSYGVVMFCKGMDGLGVDKEVGKGNTSARDNGRELLKSEC